MEMGGICTYSRITEKLRAFYITLSFPVDFLEAILKELLDCVEEIYSIPQMSRFLLKRGISWINVIQNCVYAVQ